jgi:drug/metabolite transporter (DMT)-like permease
LFIKILYLALGIFACSTSVIMIKESTTHPALLASCRLLIAAVVLSPFYFRDLRQHRDIYTVNHLKATLFPALFLGLHFITWNMGARKTSAVNATLIVTMVPIIMPFFLFFLFREILTIYEVLGTILSLIGTLLLTAADFRLSIEHFQGDLLSFLSLILLTWYLALARKNRDIPTIYLYITPLYFIAGILCFVVALFYLNPIQPYPLKEILLILGLGIIPTVFGHSLINYSMRHLRGQIVSLATPSQFIFAGVLAYFFFREIPALAFYISSFLIVAGIFVALKPKLPSLKIPD